MIFPNLEKLYNDHWGRNQGDEETKETPEFWGKMSEVFAKKAHSPASRQDTIDFINKFVWHKNETVLDVGAGPGTFAIPLAKYVKSITATDFSPEMLIQLEAQAKKENIKNIETICGRWLELNFPQKYDTVLCLNSLGVISCDSNHKTHLIETIKKLDDLANKRLLILIPHADSALDKNMENILDISEMPLERKRIAILYCAMVESGILPSIEIISRPFRWVFSSCQEVVKKILIKANLKKVPTSKICMLQDYLMSIMKKNDDGNFSLTYNTKQALFIYDKTLYN